MILAALPSVAVAQLTPPLSSPARSAIVGDVRFDLYRGYLVVASGSLGGLADRRFVIDTGANPTVLDRSVAQDLGLAGQPSRLALLNGDAGASVTVLPSLTLGPLAARYLPVFVADLSFLHRELGVRIDAIVGLDVLSAANFTIDYQARQLSFGPPPSLPHSAPFETGPPAVTINAEIDRQPARMLVDTGASGLLLFRDNRRMRGLNVLAVRGSESIAGNFERDRVELAGLRLGNMKMRNVAAYLVSTKKDVARDFDGLLGPGALGLIQVAFDFDHGRLSWSMKP